jgi:PAS domain S-box-containing protein
MIIFKLLIYLYKKKFFFSSSSYSRRILNLGQLKGKILKESEKLLSEIIDQTFIGFAIFQDFEVKYFNPEFSKVIGYPYEEIVNWRPKEFFNVIDPTDRDKVISLAQNLYSGDNNALNFFQLHIVKKSGDKVWVEIRTKPIIFEGKKADLIFLQDITSNKEAERKHIEAEERYRVLFENSPYAVGLINSEGIIVDANTNNEKMSGYKREDIVGKKFTEFSIFSKEHFNIVVDSFRKLIKGEIPEPQDLLLHKKDGSKIWVLMQASILKLDNETVFQIITQDISTQKEASEKLKESEEKFRTIAEQSFMGITIIQDDVISYANQAILDIFGYSLDEVKSWKPLEYLKLFPPKDREFILGQERKQQDEYDGSIHNYKVQFFKKNGESGWLDLFSNPIKYKGNLGSIVSVIDITERNIAEQQLKESEEKYRLIYEHTNDLINVIDEKFRYEYINEETHKRVLGYSKEDMIGKFAAIYVHPDDIVDIVEKLREGFEKGIGMTECRIKKKDGTYIWYESKGNTFIDQHGNKKALIMSRDITERKIAEQKLKESEEKYRHLFEKSPFSIILFDSEGIIKDCNSVTEEMFGFKKEDFLGKNYYHNPSINSDHLPITKKIYDQLKEGESLLPQEMKIFRADGTSIWINSQISKVKIINQTYFYSIIQDITNKKILEDIMFELNQNFFNFTSDFQENIQSLTQTAKKLSKGTLVLYAKKVFHEEGSTVQIISSSNGVINCDFTDFKQKYFINEIFKLKHETPQIFQNLNSNDYTMADPFVQKYSLKGAYGKVIKKIDEFTSIIVILYENFPDISYEEQLVLLLISDAIAIEEQRWELLEKLEEQNAKLGEIDKLKSEFLRRISHELKTPLISIKGYSQLLLYNNKGILDNDTLTMIEEITSGCVRLENLIKELIESSKLESALVKLKLTFEDLALLIKNSVNELQGVAKSRNQEIILNIHEKLITKFEKERMHEVIGNLLTNAIKYSPPSNSIVIKSEIKDRFYVISVIDNGIGFTPEEKLKLFNQFGKIYRFDQETNLAAEGSGLGLFITKKLVELHGGKIWVESEGRNKGSTFYFTLPIIKD